MEECRMKTLMLSVFLTAGAALGPSLEAQEDLPKVPAADQKAVEKLSQLGALVMPLAATTNLLKVDFRAVADKIDDSALPALKPVAEQLVDLNLGGTKVSDSGIGQLSGLKGLRRLHLEKTGIGDEGLSHLKNLTELRYLNLYSSKVTDKGLPQLQGLKNLENLFVWQTAVTEGGAAELSKALPKVNINRGWEAEAAKRAAEAAVADAKREEAKKEEAKKEAAKKEEAKKTAAGKPINAKCPVSGKDIDPAAVSVYEGQAIAFCCMECKALFDKDPAKYAGKIPELKKAPAKAEAKKVEGKPAPGKPINTVCPRLGKEIDPAQLVVYEGQTIGFCCPECKGKFEANPTKYIGKVKEFKAPEKK
jgi:YHS domain-containing protein